MKLTISLVAAILFVEGMANAATPVTYGDFGANLSFNTNLTLSGWCVSGSDTLNCTTAFTRYVAVPVPPAGNFTLASVQLALNSVTGSNDAIVQLVNSVNGDPGTTVLESWTISGLPSYLSPGVVTLSSTGGVVLHANTQYWLVAKPVSNTSNTLDIWWSNNIGIAGGQVTSLDGGPWMPLTGIRGLPAYALNGTQTNSASLGGSNPATSAPPACAGGDPVNCETGNLTETILDMSVPGRGRALAWRTYNSQGAAGASTPGPLGYGWSGPGGSNPISITDPAGRALWVNSSGGLIRSIQDPMGRRVSYEYDGHGNLAMVTDVGGNVTRYAYDSSHQLTSITDPRGNATKFTYDSSNQVIQERTAQGPSMGVCSLELGECLERQGRYREARGFYAVAHRNLLSYYGPVYVTRQAERKLQRVGEKGEAKPAGHT